MQSASVVSTLSIHMDELLKRIGWSQAELARKLETSPNTVSRWCRKGEGVSYRVAVKYLECIARGLGV